MARRRSNSEGTIFQDKDGVWWAQLPPDEQGRRPKRRAKTQREALEKLRQMQAERARGLTMSAKPTIADYAETWLETSVRRDVKPSTFHSYDYIIRHYVLPHVGEVRLDKLTPSRVRQFFNALKDAGLGPETLRNVYRRLRALIDVAVEDSYLAYNVVAVVGPPKGAARTKRHLTADEAVKLLCAVAGHRLAALYACLLGLGLRRGEALGLAWRDVDWAARTITVTQQVQAIGSTITISPPKTAGSVRTLPLPPLLYDQLRDQKAQQEAAQDERGDDWREHGLIFPSEVGTPITPRNLARHFATVLKATDFTGVRLHDLRHTFATLLGELEVPERIIRTLLGHEAGNITQHYTHTTLAAMREALERLERVLWPKADPPRETS